MMTKYFYTLTAFLALLCLNTPIFAQVATPCNAVRWDITGADGDGDDPRGTVSCGSSANTQSNIPNNGTYDPTATDAIALGGKVGCVDPNDSSIPPSTTPTPVPPVGTEILWFQYDVQPNAGAYDFQIIAPGGQNVFWELYYSNSPSVPADDGVSLGGDCSDLSYLGCGVGFTGWSDAAFFTPNPTQVTNYYIAVWATAATGGNAGEVEDLGGPNFKARFGCGDKCAVKLGDASYTVSCDGNQYIVELPIDGIAGEFTASDPGASSVSPSSIVFPAGVVSSGVFTLTYPLSETGYSITVEGDSNDCGSLTVSGSFEDVVCCTFSAQCNLNAAMQVVEGCDLTDAGAAFVDPANVFAFQVCSTPVLLVDDAASGDFCTAGLSVTRTYTLIDDTNGNGALDAGEDSATCTENFLIVDSTAPTFDGTLPGDATAECDNIPAAATLTATDNCDGAVTVNFSESSSGLGDGCDASHVITRTWTASDCSGNSVSHTQTITVSDSTAPAFDGTLPADATAECDNIPTAATLTATDNCDGAVTVNFSESSSGLGDGCDASHVITRTWTASDCSGNSVSHTQTITVSDSTAPAFDGTLPGDATAECDNIPAAATLTATDNCDGAVTVNFSESSSGLGDGCDASHVITRTWTATDCSGNSVSHTQTITVSDSTAPAFDGTLPGDATAECDNIPAAATLTATDNCDGTVDVNFSESSSGLGDGCDASHVITRTWTATDCSGNSVSHTQTITVSDSTAPAFDGTLPGDATAECDNIPAAATLTATDNCDGAVTVNFSESSSGLGDGCDASHVITRTWTASDCSGNSVSHTQTITVSDSTAPSFDGTLPADATAECDNIPAAATLTATDNCDGAVTVNFSESSSGLGDGCDASHVITRTWTASDCSGNSVSHTQTITVSDSTAPAFDGTLPGDATAECDNIPAAATLTATDNCDGAVTVNFSESSSGLGDGCDASHVITRTWTATDCSGNSVSHTQTITVSDSTAPAFDGTLPGDATAECDNIPAAATLTATDNCDGAVTVNFSESSSGLGDGCDASHVITRTWTATDCSGNSVSHTQTITVSDSTAPSFDGTLPGDATAECDDIPAAATLTATDNCDGAVTVNFSESSSGLGDGCDASHVITRTWTATDCSGNSVSHTQTITVSDSTAPTFDGTLPGDATAECDNIPAAATLTATDNCDGAVTVNFSESSSGLGDGCDASHVITRTWTATDCSGNSVSHTQTITVSDSTAPAFDGTLPADATAECDNIPAAATLTATDNCDGAVTVNFSESSSGFGDGCDASHVITRTWTASDCSGNSVSHTQTITVSDSSAPAFDGTLPGDATAECDNIPAAATLTATDNCDGAVTVNFSESSSGLGDGCDASHVITRTWTATDCSGNSVSHTQTITVSDSTAPTFDGTLPADATAECGNAGNAPTLTATDNCDGAVNVDFTESSNQIDACTTIVTRIWTASDCSGNSVSHTQTVTLTDTTPPTLNGVPADAIVGCEIPLPAEVTASDNCGGDVDIDYFEDVQDGDNCDGVYYIIRTWTATDACGNATSASQSLEVEECCETPDYCDASSYCSGYEWIKRVELNDINNWSGSNNFTDFSSISTDLVAGQTYTITLTPGYGSYCSYTENWQVWIDWNNDGDFDDADELSCQMQGKKVTCNITVPEDAANCPIRMRITMNYGCYWANPCGYFNYGEVEDYTLNIIDPDCVEAPPLEYCDIQSYCAGYEWIDLVQLGDINNVSGASTYTDYTTMSTDLEQGENYSMTVSAGYSGSAYNEYWYVWIDFNQDGDFNDPGELAAQGYGKYNETLNLNVPSNAVLGNTTMRVVMSYYCNPNPCCSFNYGEVEDYGITITAPGSAKNDSNGLEYLDLLVDENTPFSINNIYPNPAIDNVAIDYISNTETQIDLQIFDMSGKLVKQYNETALPGYNSIRIDVTNFASGTYNVAITNGNDYDNKSLVVK